MITICIILVLLLAAILLIALGAGGLLVGFGWVLLIVGDVALGIWLFVKLIKKLCKKN